MTDVNTVIGLSLGKISHKFSSQQEKVKRKKERNKFVCSIEKKNKWLQLDSNPQPLSS